MTMSMTDTHTLWTNKGIFKSKRSSTVLFIVYRSLFVYPRWNQQDGYTCDGHTCDGHPWSNHHLRLIRGITKEGFEQRWIEHFLILSDVDRMWCFLAGADRIGDLPAVVDHAWNLPAVVDHPWNFTTVVDHLWNFTTVFDLAWNFTSADNKIPSFHQPG